MKSSRFNGFPWALKPLKRLKTHIPSVTPDSSRVLLKKAIQHEQFFLNATPCQHLAIEMQ